jgi:hypothetical protein
MAASEAGGARGAGGCRLCVVAGGATAAVRSRGAGGAADSCGSSEIGAVLRGAVLGTGVGRGGVALGGGVLFAVRAVDSSGLIVSVRTRLESPALLLLPDDGANAFVPLLDPPGADGGGNPDCCDAPGFPREDEDGVRNSTGSSSRGITRSLVSRTRS